MTARQTAGTRQELPGTVGNGETQGPGKITGPMADTRIEVLSVHFGGPTIREVPELQALFRCAGPARSGRHASRGAAVNRGNPTVPGPRVETEGPAAREGDFRSGFTRSGCGQPTLAGRECHPPPVAWKPGGPRARQWDFRAGGVVARAA